jgi:hypothetical protein
VWKCYIHILFEVIIIFKVAVFRFCVAIRPVAVAGVGWPCAFCLLSSSKKPQKSPVRILLEKMMAISDKPACN